MDKWNMLIFFIHIKFNIRKIVPIKTYTIYYGIMLLYKKDDPKIKSEKVSSLY